MEVHPTFEPRSRADWRRWLQQHHGGERSVWVLYNRKDGALTYLDLVEECLCFGWIDGLAKVHQGLSAQRVTPRTAKSAWTELNKERARRLEGLGLMTPAGRKVLPDLSAPYRHSAALEAALREDPQTWTQLQAFPEAYRRVRLSYVDEVRTRDATEYQKRLANLRKKTRAGVMFGNWDDSGLKVTR